MIAWRTIISESIGPIFAIFSLNESVLGADDRAGLLSDIGMGYRYLYVRINSVNDASISCKNFTNFGPLTPELTELICEHLV